MIKEPQIARTAIFVLQPRHHVLQNRKGPTTFVDLIGRQSVAPLNIDELTFTNIVQRDQALAFAPLDRQRAARFIGEKIFDRREQVRTKSSFFLANSIQVLAL